MNAVEIISIPVTDQQRAKEFYLRLGLQVIAESPFDQGFWIQLGFPAGGATLTLVNWFDKMPAGSMQGLVVSTDNIEADIQELNSKGISIAKIDHTPWGKFATITDPDGNTISLHETNTTTDNETNL